MLKNAGLMVAGLAAGTLFLSGCGGGSSNASAQSGTAKTTTPSGPGASSAPPGAVTDGKQPSGQPSGPPQKPPSVDRARVLKYSQCMRANGVKNFPDPDASGALLMNGSTVKMDSPEFQAAQKKCGSLMPGQGGSLSTRGPGSGPAQ